VKTEDKGKRDREDRSVFLFVVVDTIPPPRPTSRAASRLPGEPSPRRLLSFFPPSRGWRSPRNLTHPDLVLGVHHYALFARAGDLMLLIAAAAEFYEKKNKKKV